MGGAVAAPAPPCSRVCGVVADTPVAVSTRQMAEDATPDSDADTHPFSDDRHR